MSIPPTYRKWTQMTRTCSCGRRWAVIERDMEEKITSEMSGGMSLENARIKWLSENNITMTCCLRDLTYPEKNQIFDSTIGALSDITINKSKPLKENFRTGDNSGNIGYEFLYRTRGVQDFDQRRYSYMMAVDSLSTFDKMEVLRRDGTTSINPGTRVIPQFPNYRITRSDNMPTIVSDVPLMSPQELTLQFLGS